MPKPISTFCNASRSHITVTRTPHIWISEDVLSETFTAFVRNHKRFGSNVPGPLEARKRASKRRATHLAHQSATVYSPESFVLFDTQSQAAWWKKEKGHSKSQASSWLWPFAPPQVAQDPSPLPTPWTIEDVLRSSNLSQHEPKSVAIKQKIRTHLQGIRTHAEAMDILSYLEVDLRRNPRLAEFILKNIIAQHWKNEEIAEFLLDPWTNPSGTTNYLYILEHAKEHIDLMLWLLRQGVFTKAARLGLLDIAEIQKILLLAPRIHFPAGPEKMTWASFCLQLMTAMDESKVLTVRDLDESFVRDWLQAIVRRNFCAGVPGLLFKMYSRLGLDDPQALENVAHTSISMVESNTICQLNSLVGFLRSKSSERVGSVLFSLTQRFLDEAGLEKPDWAMTSSLEQTVDHWFRKDLLQQVDSMSTLGQATTEGKVLIRTVFRGTLHSRISDKSEEEDRDPSVARLIETRREHVSKLELWYAVLGNLGSMTGFQSDMDENVLKDFILNRGEESDARQRLVTATWVTMALSIKTDTSIKSSGVSKALTAQLRREFLTASAVNEDVLVKLLETLQSLPLPAKNKLLRRIHELSGKLITAEQNYWDMVQTLHDLDDARILEIKKPHVYRSMKLHFPAKLRSMCESFNQDMDMFEKSCTDIIRHVKGSNHILFRVLTHNQQLQRSLVHAGLMLQSSHPGWFNLSEVQSDNLGGRSPLRLLEMIERFANEIARSEQLSSRNAFRQVYWLRAFLVRLRVQIRAPIWKALWHAHVVRRDAAGNGANYYTVTYLYDKIAKTDGYAEADRLLRISSMAHLLRKLKPDEPDKIVEVLPFNTSTNESKASNGIEIVEGADIIRISPFTVSDTSSLPKDTDQGSQSRLINDNKITSPNTPRVLSTAKKYRPQRTSSLSIMLTARRLSKASKLFFMARKDNHSRRLLQSSGTRRRLVAVSP